MSSTRAPRIIKKKIDYFGKIPLNDEETHSHDS